MNLREALDVYIDSKRPHGNGFQSGAIILWSFHRHIGNISLRDIREHHIQTFLDGPLTGPATWRNKYFVLYRLFEYWLARRRIPVLVMPEIRAAPPKTFIPYIYSRSELNRLLKAIQKAQTGCNIDAETFRALLLFLYGTGALVNEALRLKRKDVDFTGRSVTIYSNKFNSGRKLPIGADLCKILHGYCRSHLNGPNSDGYIFQNKHGKKIAVGTLIHRFQRLRRDAGITRPGGPRHQPRLHDLRHTFAVHRITSWLKHGAEMNQMIPALSVYLGQVGLSSAERYLRLTPERFRTQLNLLNQRTGRRKWRDDPALMKFLDSL